MSLTGSRGVLLVNQSSFIAAAVYLSLRRRLLIISTVQVPYLPLAPFLLLLRICFPSPSRAPSLPRLGPPLAASRYRPSYNMNESNAPIHTARQTRVKSMPKMHQNTFGGQAPPGPAGGAYVLPPNPLAAKGGKGREGRGLT